MRMASIVLFVQAIQRAYITHLLVLFWTNSVITARSTLFLDNRNACHVTIRVLHQIVILAILLMLL